MQASTILYDERTTSGVAADLDGDHLWLSPADMQQVSGWKLEPEGLCRGDACVRTADTWRDAQGRIDLAAFARHMGQPIVRDDAHGVWACGESVSARREQLMSLEAPDFTLPDIDGKLHSLSDYRGKKVFLFSWGSY